MASSARLDRLRRLIQPDVDALPNRPVSPEPERAPEPQSELAEDSDTPGGVLLEPNENIDRRFVWMKDAESSFNPRLDIMQPSATPPPPNVTDVPVTDLQRGHLASPRHNFTPIQALAKYPYKYCNKGYMQDIASAFFDQGKFWKRVWDLYYIWDLDDSKPLILVRESQVQTLLTEINKHLKLGLRITDQQREEGLVARFPDHPRCLPRYLGRSHSREDVDDMAANAPNNAYRAAGEAPHPELQPPTLKEFKQLMESMAEAQKAKNKANKAKKQQDRLTKNKSIVDQFKRAQRHLGLRESLPDQLSAQIAQSAAIDPLMPAPFVFDQSVVFVCVDVESYERAHHKITEVGIATLDTRDLIGIAPGENGKEWREMIHGRHFRINEHKHLANSDFVTGHPDGFMFGESTFIPLNEAADHVAACFRAPFGAQVSSGQEESGRIPSDLELFEKRNIIFLGHDTLGDVRYLQQLGYDPIKEEKILEAMDTATMYRVWHRDQQPSRLGKILSDFDIIGWKLHNAGNDAVYTVQAMLGICVHEATIRGSPELDELRDKEKEARLAAAREDAGQKARDDAAWWSDHEADGDGGRPVPMTPKSMSKQPRSKDMQQYDGPSEMERTGEHERGWDRSRSRALECGRGSRPVGSGRSHIEGRARARGRGRGRAQQRGHGRESSNPSANTTNLASAPQVQYYW